MNSVGIVVPHDMALDRELWRWTPDDITLLLTRTPYSPLAVTTSGAMIAAVAELGLRRVAVADPYERDVSEAFVRYLAEAGIEVVAENHLGLTSEIWRVDPDTIWQLLLATDRPDADGLLVACTNVASYDLIARVEAVLGKPVISANQATMWGLLRLIGRQPVGPGQRLLSTGQDLGEGLVGSVS